MMCLFNIWMLNGGSILALAKDFSKPTIVGVLQRNFIQPDENVMLNLYVILLLQYAASLSSAKNTKRVQMNEHVRPDMMQWLSYH